VTIPNPDHLLDQALRLASPTLGPPKQVDLRRAISAAYYAVFHAALRAAADEFIGRNKQGTPLYTLAYRSIDHASLRELCVEVRKQRPAPGLRGSCPTMGLAKT
jgi:hypothetical protein